LWGNNYRGEDVGECELPYKLKTNELKTNELKKAAGEELKQLIENAAVFKPEMKVWESLDLIRTTM